MSAGRLIGVVGPSGVGKDSLMRALAAAHPALGLVRRTITRAPDLGGEDYDAVSPDIFSQMSQNGAFCLEWHAHDLQYGIPSATQPEVAAGAQLLVNLSRGVLLQAKARFANFTVLKITASAETLASRLAARGRETPAGIKKRLTRLDYPLPQNISAIDISNDGALEDTVTQARKALYPLSE